MNGVTSVVRDLRGISRAETRPDSSATAEERLTALLRHAGLTARAVYRPGEVCRILRISRTTLIGLCALAEHPDARRDNPRALASFLIGCHHRIPHPALANWLEKNQSYQRDNEINADF